MIISRELITKVSEAFSNIKSYIPGQPHPRLVDACISVFRSKGLFSPLRDTEAKGYQWAGWAKDEILYFDFIGYNKERLVLGECKLYKNDIVPVEAVEDFIERITKVKPDGRKVSALFISNLPLSKSGYNIISGLDDVKVETIIHSKKVEEE